MTGVQTCALPISGEFRPDDPLARRGAASGFSAGSSRRRYPAVQLLPPIPGLLLPAAARRKLKKGQLALSLPVARAVPRGAGLPSGARFPGFAQIHPMAAAELLQGALALLYDLEGMLAEISGMEHVSLQPSAGAQGELTGLMLIRGCLSEKGNPRKHIIVPDTAHGTNPASSTLCGYGVLQISSNERGVIDAAAVEKA